MQRFDAGCDPGFANLGVSFVDPENERSLMMNVDLTTWGGKKHKLGFEDLGPCIREFCISNKRFFNRAERLSVERLPEKVRNKHTKRWMRTNLLVRDVMNMFTQTVLVMFPHIRIFYAAPVTLKAFAGTGGGDSHADNKRITLDKGTILPRAHMDMAESVFRDRKGIHVDPIEATECAMILRDHSARLTESKYAKPGVVREFAIVKYSSPVVYPDWNPKSKRLRGNAI